MRNQICYEWCCEYVDKNGDIQDHDWGDRKADVWPPRFNIKGCVARLCIVRMSGNDDAGETERGYAYAGDRMFSCGHLISKSHIVQLNMIDCDTR